VILIARYRQRDDIDMQWSSIRRRITRELDVQIADWRERALNELLSGAWDKFSKALQTGEVLELEAKYESFVSQALDDTVVVKVDEAA
jgi:hypothetical protein